MPRDGSGVASAPAGTKATAGTTIQSAPYNAWVDDIIAEMNSARPIVAGGTGAATAIGAFDKLDTKGADIASAATVNLNNATGGRVNVTGTTTITGVTLAEGRVRIARAAAAFTLEASSTLIVNGSGSVDYTTTAEDLLLFEGYSSNVVRVWVISRAAEASPDGGDVASAGTVSLGSGEYFHITGTTTITDIDFATPEDGRSAILVFDGALTLTHHATTLILPGGANITTAAGDSCKVVQDDTDNVRVVWYQRADGRPLVGLTLGTAQASTSGTEIDFTSIPAGTKRITVMLSGVSTNGSTALIIQLGDSGGVETTGYSSNAAVVVGASTSSGQITTGLQLTSAGASAQTIHGSYTLTLLDDSTNTWVGSGAVGRSDTNAIYFSAGTKALSAELDRVRVTTTNGSDAFDAGSINISYEG